MAQLNQGDAAAAAVAAPGRGQEPSFDFRVVADERPMDEAMAALVDFFIAQGGEAAGRMR